MSIGKRVFVNGLLGGLDSDGKYKSIEKADAQLERMLAELLLHEFQRCDIWVRLFSTELHGVQFGLRYESEVWEEDGSCYEWVMLDPNDVMFHPPWDSGEYST